MRKVLVSPATGSQRRRRLTAAFATLAAGLALAHGAAAAVAKQIPAKEPLWPPAFPGQTMAPPPLAVSRYKVETLAWGLVKPWSMIFLPDGRFLINEWAGRMRVVGRDGALSAPVEGLPLKPGNQLLDLLADPKFASNRILYFNFGEERADGIGMSVVRARLSKDGERLEDMKIVFRASTYPITASHPVPAGRMVWDREGAIIASSASAGEQVGKPGGPGDAQDIKSDAGKILRFKPDGSIPENNPFIGRPNYRADLFSLGHRDAQGLAYDPKTGTLWSIEHGPQGGDELNIIKGGHNYGWPVISYGVDYYGNRVGEGVAVKEGMDQPTYFWRPSIAPSGLLFYTGSLFPEWRGNLFVGALKGKHMSRLVLKGEAVVAEEELLSEEDSRIRSVYQGPEGALYILTDDEAGRLLRVTPAK